MNITLNEICTQLFEKIAASDQARKIAELAEELGISTRTARYNLDKIDEFLRYYKFPPLVRKQNVGVYYHPSRQLMDEILEKLLKPARYHYIATPKERQDVILAILLQQQDYTTIDYLADKLMLSRGTISKDLQQLKQALQENNLMLLSSPKHGIKISGDEKYLRRAAIELFMKSISAQGMLSQEISPVVQRIDKYAQTEITKMLASINLQFIEGCVIEAEKQLERFFSDEAFYGLVIHIALAIKRIKLGRDIVMPYQELKKYETTKEFAAASSIVSRLEEQFQLEFPYDEIGYIAIHLLGSNVYAANPEGSGDWAIMQSLTGKMLRRVSESLGQDDLIRDEQLFRGLLEHLRPAMYRLKNDLSIKNPVLAEIMTNYLALFNVVKDSLLPVESYIGKRFSDAEIGYFTLHFGAALEKRRQECTKGKRVLLVCSTGLGTARLLSSRLQQVFNVTVVEIAAYRQVKQVLASKAIDLIVTTLPVKFAAIPCVHVSPLLLAKDIDKLKTYLPPGGTRPKQSVLVEVLGVVEKYCNINEYDALISGLAQVLETGNLAVSKGEQPMLRELLTKEMIELKVPAANWEEAIYAGGEILENKGFIEHRYVEAMIATVKKMGAYIVIAKGIAMPHARPEDGVKKIGISLITLENPVEFGSEENDPVSVVVFLCAIDNVTHLNALAELMEFLDDDVFRSIADQADSKEAIIDYINAGKRG